MGGRLDCLVGVVVSVVCCWPPRSLDDPMDSARAAPVLFLLYASSALLTARLCKLGLLAAGWACQPDEGGDKSDV